MRSEISLIYPSSANRLAFKLGQMRQTQELWKAEYFPTENRKVFGSSPLVKQQPLLSTLLLSCRIPAGGVMLSPWFLSRLHTTNCTAVLPSRGEQENCSVSLIDSILSGGPSRPEDNGQVQTAWPLCYALIYIYISNHLGGPAAYDASMHQMHRSGEFWVAKYGTDIDVDDSKRSHTTCC